MYSQENRSQKHAGKPLRVDVTVGAKKLLARVKVRESRSSERKKKVSGYRGSKETVQARSSDKAFETRRANDWATLEEHVTRSRDVETVC